jgi:hypothetical protein
MKIYTQINERPYLVFPIALTALIIPVILIEYQVTLHTGGAFIYPLDDTFIHLTIARNLAFHGTWGITGGEFQSASSSLLYTLLLAGLVKIFSVHTSIPFIINGITGIILIIVVLKRLQKENINPFGQLLILLAIIFFTPVPVLIISGMEDTLQCLFSFLFIFHFSDWMEQTDSESGKSRLPFSLLLYGILSFSTRYEGLFLFAISCLLLLYKRKISHAFLLGTICTLPIILFGMYSIGKGSYFLPNPVLLKSAGPPLSLGGILDFLNKNILQRLSLSIQDGISAVAAHSMLIILPLSFLFFTGPLKKRARYRYVLILLIACCFLQYTLNTTGWFYRYEAYLILNSVVILSILFYKYRDEIILYFRRHPLMTAFILFILFLPMLSRSAAAFLHAPKACLNIYDQEYQMAKFLQTYYNNEVVAANDIGAISYFKKEKNLDLSGLASIKVTRGRKNKYYSPAFLDSLCRSEKAGIAITYDNFFSDSLLVRWDKVATWTISGNVICEDSAVSFYAIEKSMVPGLKKNLQQYQLTLPSGVRVKYY